MESAYEECLYYKIKSAFAEKQKPFRSSLRMSHFECDILVEGKLVVEVKSSEFLHPIHLAQTLTYLRLGDYRLGLLINFNVEILKDGIRRVINGNL